MQLINLKFYETIESANADKEILEKNGIESFLADDLDMDMLERVNGVVGDLNLFVEVNDLAGAQEILGISDNRSSISVAYRINNSPYNHNCPKCGSNHIFKIERDDGMLLSLLVDKIFPNLHNRFKCYYCEHEWKK